MAEQPMPTPNARPSIQGLVRHDLEQREHVGIQRYGTPLQAHNGRDALRDAYEEALDLACYLRQAIEERCTCVDVTGFGEDRPTRVPGSRPCPQHPAVEPAALTPDVIYDGTYQCDEPTDGCTCPTCLD